MQIFAESYVLFFYILVYRLIFVWFRLQIEIRVGKFPVEQRRDGAGFVFGMYEAVMFEFPDEAVVIGFPKSPVISYSHVRSVMQFRDGVVFFL